MFSSDHGFRPFIRSLMKDLGSYTNSLTRKSRNSESKASRRRSTITTDEFGTLRKVTRYNSQQLRSRSNLKLALQVEDQDIVVITGLERVPFCCPAELYSMSRQDLIRTARFLNSKLPRAHLIDTGPMHSEAYIRNKIETMVGLASSYAKDTTSPNVIQNVLNDQAVTLSSSKKSSHDNNVEFLPSSYPYKSPGLESLPEVEGELDYDPVGTELSPSRRSRRYSKSRFKSNADRYEFSPLTDSPSPKMRSMRNLDLKKSYMSPTGMAENGSVRNSSHIGDSTAEKDASAFTTGAALNDIIEDISIYDFYLSLPIKKSELRIELDADSTNGIQG